jgi:hypothetical protein
MIWSPVCELPYGPRSFIAASSEAGQMAASDYVPNFFKNRLHLAGRPQMSTRPNKTVQVTTLFIQRGWKRSRRPGATVPDDTRWAAL